VRGQTLSGLNEGTMLDFGRGVCNNFEAASQREWLVTNGIGGYAAGTIAGNLSRHYHGLLLAALNPPIGRTLMLSKLEETVVYAEMLYRLYTNRFDDGAIEPRGFERIDRFRLEGTIPVWTYAFADALLEKSIWMEQGANTTYIRYQLIRASDTVQLSLKAIVNYRDYHDTTKASDWQTTVTPVENGLRIVAKEGAVPLYIFARGMTFTPRIEWSKDYFKDIEAERGQETVEDHLCVADLEMSLRVGDSITVIASTEAQADPDGAYLRRVQYEKQIVGDAKEVVGRLRLATDQFIVKRGEGHTVIAGYPWFTDWGRDTMISLSGLTIATGRTEIAASILRTFAQHVDQGMLPNRFPDESETPEYNTVDASLWYFEAVRAYYEATKDQSLIKELFPILREMIEWHRKGTRYNIHVDPVDGLIYAGERGVQLTWMDVKIDDWVVTPRTGKPVEINALWYNALMTMRDLAWALNEKFGDYVQMAEQVKTNFSRFWNGIYLYDVVDTEKGHDASIRPNQLFAVSLYHSPIPAKHQKAVVDICARYLLTPHGLRSLSRDDEAYNGIYTGDRLERDAAYHQGTVWSWLIGPFVEAHLRVYKDKALAKTYLEPLIRHLEDHGLGSISEVFDGDAPFTPRGCFAQAWSVAEVLRLWQIVNQ
jgi:predicted glycogen debranching enzyme